LAFDKALLAENLERQLLGLFVFEDNVGDEWLRI
jgi:hypothetical protein